MTCTDVRPLLTWSAPPTCARTLAAPLRVYIQTDPSPPTTAGERRAQHARGLRGPTTRLTLRRRTTGIRTRGVPLNRHAVPANAGSRWTWTSVIPSTPAAALLHDDRNSAERRDVWRTRRGVLLSKHHRVGLKGDRLPSGPGSASSWRSSDAARPSSARVERRRLCRRSRFLADLRRLPEYIPRCGRVHVPRDQNVRLQPVSGWGVKPSRGTAVLPAAETGRGAGHGLSATSAHGAGLFGFSAPGRGLAAGRRSMPTTAATARRRAGWPMDCLRSGRGGARNYSRTWGSCDTLISWRRT